METIKIQISGEHIRLDAILKLAGVAPTGGQAKLLIQSGKVLVDGEICTQRGKKITAGSRVQAENTIIEAS